ncbi:MAG: metal ABC transporter solute-binding protein, Zn/Mn family [Anaerolineae bacterium]
MDEASLAQELSTAGYRLTRPRRAVLRVVTEAANCFGVALMLTLAACGPSATSQPASGAEERLQVVATTTIVGDVVHAVGGDVIALTVLLPLGTDPHSYEPTPQDVAAVADADVVFVNGAGLEVFLDSLLENAGGDAQVVSVSEGITFRHLGGEHGNPDPHVWFDPHNVAVWVANVEQTLSASDPANAEVYAANGSEYKTALQELDAWIRDQVAQIPEANRKLVTDHAAFGYFADRYGFEQVGAVFPGFSTLAEPSAQERAELEEAIRAFDVQAIFVGTTVNPGLAQQVAEDTGARVVFLYTGSLSEPGGPADSYLALMRYDVSAIVDALK